MDFLYNDNNLCGGWIFCILQTLAFNLVVWSCLCHNSYCFVRKQIVYSIQLQRVLLLEIAETIFWIYIILMSQINVPLSFLCYVVCKISQIIMYSNSTVKSNYSKLVAPLLLALLRGEDFLSISRVNLTSMEFYSTIHFLMIQLLFFLVMYVV